MHIAIAVIVLLQPAVSIGASAAMQAGSLNAATEMVAEGEMPGCHGASPVAPDCCADMNGTGCGMDCGTASSAISQPPLSVCPFAHIPLRAALPGAAPQLPPSSLYKPPRTS
jgi:hypothetical protein